MKLFQRYYILFLVLICVPTSIYSMVTDNRYFPWFNHPYNGTDHQHGCFRADPFFITGTSAWKIKPGVRQIDQETGFPDLQGELDYYQLGIALEMDGKPNPIPSDWRNVTDFPMLMPGSFQGQGISFAGYAPLTNHFGIGATFLFFRLMSQANILPAASTARQLNLAAPGNQARLTQLTQDFEAIVGTQNGYIIETGVGDVDLFIRFYDVREYIFYCRKMDASVAVGLLVPTGVQESLYSIASVPFGGNGFWGWYIAPALEFELKEDWKLGFVARVQKRFARTVLSRIPIADESALFAPVIGNLNVNPGTTFMFAPYFALEDIREGLGAMVQYTVVAHLTDGFTDEREDASPAANFTNMLANSSWVSEYVTVEGLYDLSFGQPWSYKPLFTLSLDLPLSLLGARGCAKTSRITLGLTVDF